MFFLDPPARFALSALLSACAALVWAVRRRP